MTRIDLGQPIDICWFIERRETVICLKNKTNISLGYENLTFTHPHVDPNQYDWLSFVSTPHSV